MEGVYINGCVNLKTRLINAARISCTGWTKNCKHLEVFQSSTSVGVEVLDLEVLSSESSWDQLEGSSTRGTGSRSIQEG